MVMDGLRGEKGKPRPTRYFDEGKSDIGHYQLTTSLHSSGTDNKPTWELLLDPGEDKVVPPIILFTEERDPRGEKAKKVHDFALQFLKASVDIESFISAVKTYRDKLF